MPAAAAVLDASLVASRRVPLIDVTAWALATPVQAVAGAGFYRGALATMSRDVPWNALAFLFHGQAKSAFASAAKMWGQR